MNQTYSGARTPKWSFRLLDQTDQPIGTVDGVTGGSCEITVGARLGTTGSITIDERGQEIDWMSHRVQVRYDPGLPGVAPWAVCTMLFSSPQESHISDGRTVYDVDLVSKMIVIDEDTVISTFSLAAGTLLIEEVIELIQSTGESRIAATESTATLSNPLVWEIGTSKLTIINDLLRAAGYDELWCDGSGQFRLEPYVLPSNRAVSFAFEAGEHSLHSPEWQKGQELSNVPNRFVVVGQGTDEHEPRIGVAVNVNPESPFSYPSRGRWITATENGVEGESQEIFDQLAQRKLIEAMSPAATFAASHAIVPLEVGQMIRFTPSHQAAHHAIVQRMSFDFTFDAQCSADWEQVQTL